MFKGKFVSCRTGTSKNTGNQYYQIEVIAETLDGGAKVYAGFCTESAYQSAAGLSAFQEVKVACGVTSQGYITVAAIKPVEG